jgi:hypothetical protein
VAISSWLQLRRSQGAGVLSYSNSKQFKALK